MNAPEQMPSQCGLWPSISEAKGPVPGHVSEGAAPPTAARLLKAIGIICPRTDLEELWWAQSATQILTGFNREQDFA